MARYISYNGAICERSGPVLSVITPAAEWSYAVEFARSATVPRAAYLIVRIKLKVSRGAVGVGILKGNSRDFIKETQVASAGGWQEVAIEIPAKACIGSLMFRNVSYSGHSEATIELLPLEICDEMTVSDPPRLELDASSLDRFGSWAGMVPAGCSADWTGLKTRATVQKYSERELDFYNKARYEAPTVEVMTEQVIDWVPLADAVSSAEDTFRMAALGAGWGRWLSAGGALAKKIGKSYFLVGIEADAEHFRWMTEHFAENGFDPSNYKLIEAAAAGVSGTCHFAVGDSQAWYGQSIIKDSERTTAFPSTGVRTVRAITIQEILREASPLDYLHLDIQGAELEVLSSYPDLLEGQVRLINVGTHSVEIEAGLRQLFRRHKWQPLYDIKTGSSMLVRVGSKENVIEFQDGAQVWRNPKLLST